jgi:hypothetical protein
MDLFKNPVGSLPTKGWLQVSQKTMIFCCFSTVVVGPLVRQKLKFLNNSNIQNMTKMGIGLKQICIMKNPAASSGVSSVEKKKSCGLFSFCQGYPAII